MDSHDPRDLDGVIDAVARAMTRSTLARDLRPAVAARIASPAPWLPVWRAGLAGAVAAVVLAAVMLRPGPEPQPPAAGTNVARAVTPPRPAESTNEAAPADESLSIESGRTAIPVTRQTVVDDAGSAGIVEISPMAIVPLGVIEEDAALESPQLVEIAPLDVEPVSIAELDLVEERARGNEREELP